jgi:uncharacterized protein (TIGR02145 family)
MKPIPKLLVTIILSFVLMQSCTKSDTDSPINSDVLTLTTTLPSSIGTATASCGGTVITDGDSTVTARGVVWSTMPNPTIALATKTTDGTGTGVFTSMLSGLNPSTTYYVKAYATNSAGTSYGNELSFSTTLTDVLTLTTTSPSSIATSTALCGGTIITDGGSTVTARGVVWSTMPNPTIALATKTTNGTGTGVFTSVLSGLNPSTTYYVKAYATNSAGTSYGNELSFSTTLTDVLTLTTTLPSSIATSTASCGGTVITDGGSTVTARGVVWSTMPNPTIALATKTTNGTGTGMFTSVLSGLNPSTTYYVKAYATNSTGTSYGNELSFATLQSSSTTVTDVDGNTYPLVTICTQVWTTKNLAVTAYSDGTVIPQVTDPTAWTNLTTGAWCYYNSDATNNATYGKLYNWYAAVGIYDAASLANPTLRKKLAPTGWHVPTDAEWTTLTTCLGESVAGGKMKETGTAHWLSPNTDATNSSGFTGLPGGCRHSDGTFYNVGNGGFWWNSSENDTPYASFRALNYNVGFASWGNFSKNYGVSVRCLRD